MCSLRCWNYFHVFDFKDLCGNTKKLITYVARHHKTSAKCSMLNLFIEEPEKLTKKRYEMKRVIYFRSQKLLQGLSYTFHSWFISKQQEWNVLSENLQGSISVNIVCTGFLVTRALAHIKKLCFLAEMFLWILPFLQVQKFLNIYYMLVSKC